MVQLEHTTEVYVQLYSMRRDGQATGMGRREVPFTALSCLSCVQLVYHGTWYTTIQYYKINK